MEIYLIRHTTPDVPRGTSYGRSDVPLRPSFPEELATVRRKLDGAGMLKFYTSPLQRCRRLADALAGEGATADPRLLEIDFGEWEMKRWEGENTVPVLQSIIHQPAPHGESYMQVRDRAVTFFDEVSRLPLDRVGLVTHAGVIRVIVASVLHMPFVHLFTLVPALGSVTRIDVNGDDVRLLYFSK